MVLWQEVLAALRKTRPRHLPYLCGEAGGLKIILVDGNKVKLRKRRDAKSSRLGEPDFLDFVEGGNYWEDSELCLKDEVYVDACLDPICWPFVAMHEITESLLMAKGLSYDDAHKRANEVEKALRFRFPAFLPESGGLQPPPQ
jgi:hypothetical protein